MGDPDMQLVVLGLISLFFISLVLQFPFLDRPPLESLEKSLSELKQLQVLHDDAQESLTPLGDVLSRIPVDIPLGKMLVLGSVFQLIDPIMVIAACMSVQSPFVRVAEDNPDLMAVCPLFPPFSVPSTATAPVTLDTSLFSILYPPPSPPTMTYHASSFARCKAVVLAPTTLWLVTQVLTVSNH